MPVTQDRPAPYGPPKVIIDLVQRHRNKGLPSPIDQDVLARAGVPDSLIPRTLQSLRILDLITEDGSASEALERIRLAPEAEYQQRLTEWLNAAYADALAFVDPAKDDETAIRDAFRKYVPTGQQSRMVTLFIGLFIAAGVMPERSASAPPRKLVSAGAALRPRPVRTHAPALTRVSAGVGSTKRQPPEGNFPPAMSGLLASLPSNGSGWTKESRDKFMATFPVILDFCYPIETERSEEDRGEHENGSTD